MVTLSSMVSENGFGTVARQYAHALRSRQVRSLEKNLDLMTGIGVMREGPLHAALKAWLARPGDRLEVPVDGFVIDLVRADGELVEIQTGSFSPLRSKMDALLDAYRVRIVHPIPSLRRIVRVDADGRCCPRAARRCVPDGSPCSRGSSRSRRCCRTRTWSLS